MRSMWFTYCFPNWFVIEACAHREAHFFLFWHTTLMSILMSVCGVEPLPNIILQNKRMSIMVFKVFFWERLVYDLACGSLLENSSGLSMPYTS